MKMIVGDSHSAEDRTVAAGYDNGDLKLFDLKKMAVRWEKNVGNGVRNAHSSPPPPPPETGFTPTLRGGYHPNSTISCFNMIN